MDEERGRPEELDAIDEYTENAEDAQREPQQPEGFSRAHRTLLVLVAAAAIALTVGFFAREAVFTIRTLYVNGNRLVSWETVARAAGLNQSSNYFNLDEKTIREGINSHRYLTFLSMEKHFPSGLTLNVKERTPSACIRYIGIDYIMAEDGVILEKGQDLPLAQDLASISGLAFSTLEVGSVPTVRNAGQMEACVSLVGELVMQNLAGSVQSISFTNAGTIHMLTRDGFNISVGDGQYMRAKVGTVRAVLGELRKQHYQGGSIEATVPGEATYMPAPENGS